MTKREETIYKMHGISVSNGKLVSPIGLINPVLKQGNTKVGKNVWTFSTLPTNKLFQTEFGIVSGTCPCTCKGGYCQSGHYHRGSVIRSMAINTILAYKHLDWLKMAIIAQLETLRPCYVRIHATGDFFSDDYATMWEDIVVYDYDCTFWTYTKVAKFESIFDKYPNANIVKSILPGGKFNYGHCEDILHAKAMLESIGEEVHICPCGVDDSQHCENCTGCSASKWVLFIEHSTDYVAKADPFYASVVEAISNQPRR